MMMVMIEMMMTVTLMMILRKLHLVPLESQLSSTVECECISGLVMNMIIIIMTMLMTRIETGLESILRYDGHDEDNDENLFWRAFWEECVNIVSGLDQININITIFTSIYI